MRYVLIALSIAVSAIACGGDDDASASAAAVEMYGYFSKGQFGRQYDMLHPAQQAVITKDAFIACGQAGMAFSLSDIHAVDEFDEPISVPKVGEIPTRAVTMEFTFGELEQTRTIHMINVDGSWRWTLSHEHVAAYEAGTCP